MFVPSINIKIHFALIEFHHDGSVHRVNKVRAISRFEFLNLPSRDGGTSTYKNENYGGYGRKTKLCFHIIKDDFFLVEVTKNAVDSIMLFCAD
jgi:hypothetical protein